LATRDKRIPVSVLPAKTCRRLVARQRREEDFARNGFAHAAPECHLNVLVHSDGSVFTEPYVFAVK
jgi:hypothetical protein